MGRAFLAALLATAAIAATHLPARAADPDLPPVTPPDKPLLVTLDDATSTSRCIGKPVTPLCTLDTFKACMLRSDNELCKIAVIPKLARHLGEGWVSPTLTIRYWVLFRKRIRRETHYIRGMRMHALPGDVRLDAVSADCYSGKCDRFDPNMLRVTYLFRKEKDGWRLFEWDTPRYD